MSQAEASRADGLQVRNTFIDIVAPFVAEEAVSPHRPRSAPPQRAAPATLRVSEVLPEAHHEDSRTSSPRPSHYSWASTADSEGHRIRDEAVRPPVCAALKPETLHVHPLAGSWQPVLLWALPKPLGHAGDSGVHEHGTLFPLPSFVQRECAFLQLRGYSLLPETGQRLKRRGPRTLLRFYVRGLPWVKRRSWQRTLLLAVSAVLQRCGCSAVLRDDELFAPLMVVGSTEAARIEFVADASP